MLTQLELSEIEDMILRRLLKYIKEKRHKKLNKENINNKKNKSS